MLYIICSLLYLSNMCGKISIEQDCNGWFEGVSHGIGFGQLVYRGTIAAREVSDIHRAFRLVVRSLFAFANNNCDWVK